MRSSPRDYAHILVRTDVTPFIAGMQFIAWRHPEGVSGDGEDVSEMKVTDAVFEGLLTLEKSRDEKFASSRPDGINLLYASQLGHCARRWGFQQLFNREQDRFSKETLLIFADGNATEETILSSLQASSLEVVSTQQSHSIPLPLHENWQVRGRSDAILKLGPGVRFPLEIKSMNSKNFSIANAMGPQKSHLHQLAFYVHVGKYSFGRLLYKEKNTASMQEFELSYEDSAELNRTALSQYSQSVTDVLNQNHLILGGLTPLQLTTPDECRYCAYQIECTRATNKGIEPR